VKHSTICFFTC